MNVLKEKKNRIRKIKNSTRRRMRNLIKGKFGITGNCWCPVCKKEFKHELGIPCFQTKCPECKGNLMRKHNLEGENE